MQNSDTDLNTCKKRLKTCNSFGEQVTTFLESDLTFEAFLKTLDEEKQEQDRVIQNRVTALLKSTEKFDHEQALIILNCNR